MWGMAIHTQPSRKKVTVHTRPCSAVFLFAVELSGNDLNRFRVFPDKKLGSKIKNLSLSRFYGLEVRILG